jgi:hypothetical protein
MKAMWSACLASILVGAVASTGWAQESKSAALAKQLAAALDAAKISTLAVRDPGSPTAYVGVFYLSGSQLLVVGGNYSAPELLDARISRREFRDAYIDLNSASEPTSRLLIEDSGADGLKAMRSPNEPIDAVNAAGKRISFDKAQPTPEDLKAFAAADERYARMLTTLIRAVGGASTKVAVR